MLFSKPTSAQPPLIIWKWYLIQEVNPTFYQVLHLIEFIWYLRHILDGQARLAKSDVAKIISLTDLIIFLQSYVLYYTSREMNYVKPGAGLF